MSVSDWMRATMEETTLRFSSGNAKEALIASCLIGHRTFDLAGGNGMSYSIKGVSTCLLIYLLKIANKQTECKSVLDEAPAEEVASPNCPTVSTKNPPRT